MKPLIIRTKIRKWENNYIYNKDGRLSSCLWNGIVREEIKKLELLLEETETNKKSLEQKIRDKAEKVVMDYLTDGNPDGDFTKSTIGADDFKLWWMKGYTQCLEDCVDISAEVRIPQPPMPPPARIIKEGQKPIPPKSQIIKEGQKPIPPSK